MRNHKWIARIVLISTYPALYLMWVNVMRNTYIENDIMHSHPDVLYPEFNRFKKRNPTIEYEQAVYNKKQNIQSNKLL